MGLHRRLRGLPLVREPQKGIDSSFTGFWIASFAALVVAFLCTYFFGFSESDLEGGKEVKKVRLGKREPN